MSPKFLDLAKKAKGENSLSDIKKPDGTCFQSEKDRNNFIREYYRNIYSKAGPDVNPYAGCIEDFLGPDILNNPVVRNSKISPELNAEMENHFTVQELDKAIEGIGAQFLF
jgi:hypothetical protein